MEPMIALNMVLPVDAEYRRLMLSLTPHQHITKAYAHVLTARLDAPPALNERLDAILDELALVMAATYSTQEVTP